MGQNSSRAASLKPEQRKQLFIEMQSSGRKVTSIANREGVSRKFLYQQQQKGNQALEKEFNPSPEESDILYWIPVTQKWIFQVILALIFKLEEKMNKAKKKGQGNRWSKKLTVARLDEQKAQTVAGEVSILCDWLRNDILALAGPDWAERRELWDFIVAEFKQREALCLHRMRPFRTALENQKENLLAFAAVLDEKLTDISQRFNVPLYLVRKVCLLQAQNAQQNSYWATWNQLHDQIGYQFYLLSEAVEQAMKETPRASSLVENFNSRLRNYFFLRRTLGNDYLDLLRFFLNHLRFLLSEHPEREGQCPTEFST